MEVVRKKKFFFSNSKHEIVFEFWFLLKKIEVWKNGIDFLFWNFKFQFLNNYSTIFGLPRVKAVVNRFITQIITRLYWVWLSNPWLCVALTTFGFQIDGLGWLLLLLLCILLIYFGEVHSKYNDSKQLLH